MKEKDAVSKDILELVNRLPGLNYGSSDGERKHLDAIGILSLPGPRMAKKSPFNHIAMQMLKSMLWTPMVRDR